MTEPVNASIFARNFGRYRDQAMAEGVVRVESHGRAVGAFLSPREYAEYERLKRREREVVRVVDLTDAQADDLRAALEQYGQSGA